eukprot:NODE_14995_length_227_cov_9.955056_g14082_i0.p2 GENE.NODE_14995_length_227_cov_9.955056_g14082_i0~~NODE_14995_length_227_cov_9.955056_g14082_i0.p2  ORF type:complete len:61 (+),score=11.14 NODE_14995_length_227_cov_9.955056_g14082_i0:25-183(+)
MGGSCSGVRVCETACVRVKVSFLVFGLQDTRQTKDEVIFVRCLCKRMHTFLL